MSLQLPWHKGALPGAGRDPNLIEPVIYYWGSRKVASRGFALAHHPGSELKVRVPARPYRHMQHTLLKMRRLVKYCGMGRCIVKLEDAVVCRVLGCSETKVKPCCNSGSPVKYLILSAAGKGSGLGWEGFSPS
jgi:hypothetical protein